MSTNASERSFKIHGFNKESDDYSMLQDMLGDLGGETRAFNDKNIKAWGQNPQDMLSAMTKIAYHETGGSLDPFQEQLQGKKGQEGMGLFQYEKGEGHGAHTAINRLTDYFEGRDMDVPEWVSSVDKESGYDVSGLSPSQQYMLFLGDKAMDPTAHMRDIDKPGGVKDLWEKEHWAGHKYEKDSGELLNPNVVKDRLESFDESMGLYKDTLLDQMVTKEKEIKEEPVEPQRELSFFDKLSNFFSKPFDPERGG